MPVHPISIRLMVEDHQETSMCHEFSEMPPMCNAVPEVRPAYKAFPSAKLPLSEFVERAVQADDWSRAEVSATLRSAQRGVGGGHHHADALQLHEGGRGAKCQRLSQQGDGRHSQRRERRWSQRRQRVWFSMSELHGALAPNQQE